jgi:hypothetical protein
MRWNDLSGPRGYFNLKLIPTFDWIVAPGEDPFLAVVDLKFTAVDEFRPLSPETNGYGLIKIDMKLKNSQGDSLIVSNLVSKRNNP